MRMFITSKNKYLLNDMKIFGTCSIPLIKELYKYSQIIQTVNYIYIFFMHINTWWDVRTW